MKNIIILYLFLLSYSLFCCEQVNDIIIYNGKECELHVHYTYPSPLELYKDSKYKFTPLSTANYRGHIATWRIEDNKLFLDNVKIVYTNVDESKKLVKIEKNIKLSDIFPEDKIFNNTVFANWFSGTLLIKSDSYKDWYDSSYNDDKFYTIKFKYYIIITIINGMIQYEEKFLNKDFWENQKTVFDYNNISDQKINALNDFFNYINSVNYCILDSQKNSRLFYTENDFDLFLNRYFYQEVKIPLTECCIIIDSNIDFHKHDPFKLQDIRIKENNCILLIEMDSLNVPSGPWNPYIQGDDIQIIFDLDKLRKRTYTFNEHHLFDVKYVNEYGKYDSTKFLDCKIKIITIKDNYAILKGKIILNTENPNTHQSILFRRNKIPIYTVKEYLKKASQKNNLFGEVIDPEELYIKILKKSQ